MATSEVENLLEDIDRDLGDCNKAPDCSYFHNRMVDLIDLARAEGAEQAKAEIRKAAVPAIPGEYIRVDAEGCVLLDPTPFQSNRKDYEAKVFLVPASVLAPTREGEK